MRWFKRNSGSSSGDVAHEAVRRERTVDGLVTPAFIHNGPSYFFIGLPVYADGLIDAWELVDAPLFAEMLQSGWVTPHVPDGEQIHVHGLGAWSINKGSWELTAHGIGRRVKDLVQLLNPEMQNLYNCRGETTATVGGVRYSILGVSNSRAEPSRAVDESPLPRQVTGHDVFILARHDQRLFLSTLRVFQDEVIELGWLPERVLFTRSEFREAARQGDVLAEPKVGDRVTISSLGSFEVADVLWSTDVEELLKEVDDLVEKLNGRPDAITRCRATCEAYLANPTVRARERLKAAYEAIPEHNRRYVGDMDTKDIPIRMIIYGDEEIEGWSHRAVARAQGMDLPTITVPQPRDDGESRPLVLGDLANIMSDSSIENGRFHLCPEQPVTNDEAAAWQDRPGATALFLSALAKIAIAHSEPDEDVGGGGLQATWNFDYYKWRLWLAERSDDQAVVLLERSTTGGRIES